ncbi:hypothetical protein ROT00_07300 [Agromyces mediolanus]|uniref:hypothetical protein n=1 Tax=Agromyces mediolanus TaxID=41986 RepID=UPI003837D3F9
MKVEVLHIAGCPSWQEAGAQTRRALDVLGMRDVDVNYRLIASAADAEATRFAGSPTILIDGQDAFASTERVTALSCRLYPTPDGLRDSPTLGQIIEAIRARRL